MELLAEAELPSWAAGFIIRTGLRPSRSLLGAVIDRQVLIHVLRSATVRFPGMTA